MQPRFQPGNIEANLKLVEAIKAVAARMGCVPSQVALAWVLRQGDHMVAIPGTTKVVHLETNLGALDCRLGDEDRGVLNKLADKVMGDRYSPEEMAGVSQ